MMIGGGKERPKSITGQISKMNLIYFTGSLHLMVLSFSSAHSIDDDSWKHDKFEEIVALESEYSNINNSRTKKHYNKKQEHVKSKIIDKRPNNKEASAQVQKIVHHKQEATKKDFEISNSPAIIHVDMERLDVQHSNGMEVKAKLNPDAKEFQPQIYNPYDGQPVRFISAIPQQIQPIPWLTTPSPYFGVSMQTQPISFENGSQRYMNPIKRKPVVSDKPIGVNAKVD